jgi:hypothetical protein
LKNKAVGTDRDSVGRATKGGVMGKKQPAHEIKLGKIRVAIWANETEDQKIWFTAVVSRIYKSGDQWRGTTTLKHDDLPIAMKAIDMAYAWIWEKNVQVKRAERSAASEVLADAGR